MLGPKVLRVVVLTLNSIIMLGPTLLQASCMTGKHIYVPHLPKQLYVYVVQSGFKAGFQKD